MVHQGCNLLHFEGQTGDVHNNPIRPNEPLAMVLGHHSAAVSNILWMALPRLHTRVKVAMVEGLFRCYLTDCGYHILGSKYSYWTAVGIKLMSLMKLKSYISYEGLIFGWRHGVKVAKPYTIQNSNNKNTYFQLWMFFWSILQKPL